MTRRGAQLSCGAAMLAVGALGAVCHPVAQAQGQAPDAVPDAPEDALDIVDVRPMDPPPGSAVRVELARPLGDSDPIIRFAGEAQSVQRVSAHEVAFTVPDGAQEGIHPLRIERDGHVERLVLRVKSVQPRKVWRELLGGLALFLLGLRSLGQGLRSSVGQRDRSLLVGATRGPARALGFGAVLGAMTQSTTSAAAVLIGLGQARMVAADAGLWVLMGAYLGTVVTAALLPLAPTREALFVIAVGTLLLLLAPRRRLRGLATVVVAFGLLALGLRYIQSGFQSLLGDRQLMALLGTLGGDAIGASIMGAGVGAVLGALLQGPGPVFVLVLGVAQSSGALDLPTALTVLSGAALGSALGVAVLSLPYGQQLRSLRRGFLGFGLVALAMQLLTQPLWPGLADLLVAGAPGVVEPGKKIMLPNIGEHLGVGFVLSQVAGLLLFAVILRVRSGRRSEALPTLEEGVAAVLSPAVTLAAVVEDCARAVDATVSAALTHGAPEAAEAEAALSQAERTLAELSGSVARLPEAAAGSGAERGQGPLWLELGQLQHACVMLLRDVEAAMADDRRMPRELEGSARGMAELLQLRLSELAEALRAGRAPDLRAAQAMEIRLNAMEADARARLLAHGDGNGGGPNPALAQLTAGLEQVGNHAFRMTAALGRQEQAELL